MKLHFTFLMTLFCATFLTAQTVVDFEAFELAPASFLNGSDGSGGFSSGDVFLPNLYNANYDSWTGWAISNTTDTTTPGFVNQYSAIAGSGFGGSSNYAVTFAFDNNIILQGDAAGQPVPGMYITNGTYPFLSMRDGDAFAKKFGGVTGDDPDFFLLTIRAFSNGELSTESVDFYLADYRFEDNTLDFIVDEWTWVDLSTLGAADSLAFELTSTDIGQYGMNTPAYFCLDQIFALAPISSTANHVPNLFEIYPNPTTDYIQINHSENEPMDLQIYDQNGRQFLNKALDMDGDKIDIQFLPSGSYIVVLQNEEVYSSKIVLKK